MKKLFYILAVALLITGCNIDGFNEYKVRQTIIQEFQSSEVVSIPGRKWEYLVRKPNGEIWIAETRGLKAEVTASTLVFSAYPNSR